MSNGSPADGTNMRPTTWLTTACWNGLFLLTLAPSAGDTLLILNLEGPGTGYLAPIQTSMRATCMPLNSHPEASTTMRERLGGKISLGNMMLSSRLQLTNTSHSTTSRLQEILLVYLVHDSCSVDSFWISLWMTWRLEGIRLRTFNQ